MGTNSRICLLSMSLTERTYDIVAEHLKPAKPLRDGKVIYFQMICFYKESSAFMNIVEVCHLKRYNGGIRLKETINEEKNVSLSERTYDVVAEHLKPAKPL